MELLRNMRRSLWRLVAFPTPALAKDTRGAVMAEYVIILGTVCLAAAASIAALGPVLLASYERARGILISPFP